MGVVGRLSDGLHRCHRWLLGKCGKVSLAETESRSKNTATGRILKTDLEARRFVLKPNQNVWILFKFNPKNLKVLLSDDGEVGCRRISSPSVGLG